MVGSIVNHSKFGLSIVVNTTSLGEYVIAFFDVTEKITYQIVLKSSLKVCSEEEKSCEVAKSLRKFWETFKNEQSIKETSKSKPNVVGIKAEKPISRHYPDPEYKNIKSKDELKKVLSSKKKINQYGFYVDPFSKEAKDLDDSILDAVKKVDLIYSKLGSEYISVTQFNALVMEYNDLFSNFQNLKTRISTSQLEDNRKILTQLDTKLKRLESNLKDSNNEYLLRFAESIDENILSVHNNKLDQYQIAPILVNEKNVLVIAGAGTGKTSTIIGKLKYLLMVEKIKPENILALTYTKASSENMRMRIKFETNLDLDVYTFHKLGLDIIASVDKRVPDITNVDVHKFIRETIVDLANNRLSYRKKLIDYLGYHKYLGKTEFDFKTKVEYDDYTKMHPNISLKGDKLRSAQEVVIANFLYLNGIEYEYERKYSFDTATDKYSQYSPDFYLPEYNIWIEHFAVNRKGNVPDFFEGKFGKTAKETYLQSMIWKRNIHKINHTKLVETYSYLVTEGRLVDVLTKELLSLGVEVKPIDYVALSRMLLNNGKTINGLVELFATVINLAKSKNIDAIRFISMDMDRESRHVKNLIFPIFERYEMLLRRVGDIDFSDMINKAIEYLDNGKFKSMYTHVVVDEFQDMSNLTFRFLQALRKSNSYNLMCVGDDWQSIYRFMGSDICYITSFDQFFGPAEKFEIVNSYRFSKSIAEISGTFIQKNLLQLRKQILCSSTRQSFDLGLIEGNNAKDTVAQMSKCLDALEQNSEVLFLGRFNDDIKKITAASEYVVKYDPISRAIRVIYDNRSDLQITFRSTHSAKGLEADYVFILNNGNGPYGFPSSIQDEEIIQFFLAKREGFPFGEERRLFYVALTRTRKKVWLIVNKDDESSFVKEIKRDFSPNFDNKDEICPQCGKSLLVKEGKYGKFLGCAGYPSCNFIKNLEGNTYKPTIYTKKHYKKSMHVRRIKL